MQSKLRYIKIASQKIWLTPNYAVDLAATNFPSSLQFRAAEPIYWQLQINHFDQNAKKLTVVVEDYYPLQADDFEDQKMKGPVRDIEFQQVEWKYLEPFLASYKKEELGDLIIDSEEVFIPDQTPREISYATKVAFKDLRYRLGYVAANIFVELLQEEVEIRILNPNIIPEFEFIKSYFQKRFRKKYTAAGVKISLVGHRIKDIQASSRDIESIDEAFIATIKQTRTLNLLKPPLVTTIDKALFTTDDIFDAFEEDHPGNVFDQTAHEIIKLLSAEGVVRNRKQLEYLAGRRQKTDFKIHLTLNPIMGFLFLLAGQKMYHFCWELLNSHATYLWSFEESDIQVVPALAEVERIIQMIRDHGRERYKQAYRAGNTDSPLIFSYLVHRDAGSKLKDPFPRWRQQLEERLI